MFMNEILALEKLLTIFSNDEIFLQFISLCKTKSSYVKFSLEFDNNELNATAAGTT